MSLADQNASMMVGLGQSQLEHLGLQATLQEILDLQTENVIELHAGFIQHSDTNQTTQQSVTCKTTTLLEIVGSNALIS